MSWRLRPGVVLIDVCGAPVLVAKREIWDDFPHILSITGIGKIILKLMENGSPREQIVRIYAALSRSEPEEAERKVDAFIRELFEAGFLEEGPDGEGGA